jgi:hypothetical protein
VAESVLTEPQRELLRLFFELPESSGYLLAGGAALVATGVTERPTRDLDLFSSDSDVGIGPAGDAFEAAAEHRGWSVERIQDSPTFRRLVIHATDGDVLVDLAIDSPPTTGRITTTVGPTYAPHELAARKLLALFDRAAARDFVDLQAIANRFDLDGLLDTAAAIDPGFDTDVLVQMLGTLDRFEGTPVRRTGWLWGQAALAVSQSMGLRPLL